MKVCVFSDSHGYADNMIAAIGIEKPDLCFFLGDGERDLEEVAEAYPDLRIHAVRGNCDFFSMLNNTVVCSVGGVCILATHGHTYNVKYEHSFDSLTSAAVEAGADVALFGHSHRQHISRNRGVLLVNPGSAGGYGSPGYAVLTIENGNCSAELKKI